MLQLQATGDGFAPIWADGSVIAWGFTRNGLDITALQDQLKNVEQVQATQSAVAAIMDHGSVITWGEDPNNESTFAAILAVGLVITWGYSENCGNSTAFQDQLKNVQQI